jgi:hypothetical protein
MTRRINIELQGGPYDGRTIDDTEPKSRYTGTRHHDLTDNGWHTYTYEPAYHLTEAGRRIYRLVAITPTTHPTTQGGNQ